MLGHREMTMEDYADILRRRFWLVLGSAVLFLGIGIGITFIVQPRYQSQTLILIEQQKIPEDYVKPVVEQDLDSRLATMKEQILSRSRIEPIIQQFNLFAKETPSMDDRIEMNTEGYRSETDRPQPVVAWDAGFLYYFYRAGRPHSAAGMRQDVESGSSARI